MKKLCIACGVEFKQKRIDQSSCGDKKCRRKAWKIKNRDKVNEEQRKYFRNKAREDWIEKSCAECGCNFLPSIRHKNTQIYCSTKCRERNFRYSERGKELHNFHSKNRRHNKRANGGNFTESEWNDMKDKYNNTCPRCHEDNVKLTIDHIVPIVLGGEHSMVNIQPLCAKCNSEKHTTIEFYPARNVGQPENAV